MPVRRGMSNDLLSGSKMQKRMNLQNNATIRCVIVDDEPPARDIIRRYIGEMPMLELVEECGNAMEALQVLQRRPVDLLFLDIRMPQLKGTELVKILKN